jgi:hypothetical protein
MLDTGSNTWRKHMSGLEQAFYIVALVYMGISLLIIFGLLAAVIIIRNKVINLENIVREKFDVVFSVGSAAGDVIDSVRKITKRKSK